MSLRRGSEGTAVPGSARPCSRKSGSSAAGTLGAADQSQPGYQTESDDRLHQRRPPWLDPASRSTRGNRLRDARDDPCRTSGIRIPVDGRVAAAVESRSGCRRPRTASSIVRLRHGPDRLKLASTVTPLRPPAVRDGVRTITCERFSILRWPTGWPTIVEFVHARELDQVEIAVVVEDHAGRTAAANRLDISLDVDQCRTWSRSGRKASLRPVRRSG